MGSFCQGSPFLLSVLSVPSDPAWLKAFGLTLALTLEPSLTLEPDNRSSLTSALCTLSSPASPSLTLLTSSLGILHKAMVVPLSVCSRLASMPAATSEGSTSLMRRHSHLALLG